MVVQIPDCPGKKFGAVQQISAGLACSWEIRITLRFCMLDRKTLRDIDGTSIRANMSPPSYKIEVVCTLIRDQC